MTDKKILYDYMTKLSRTNSGVQTYSLEFLVDLVCAQHLNIVSEPFIQPNVIPPLHGNEVPKPLKVRTESM